MIPAIRGEVRKLLTVRSTYFILLACVLIIMFFAFFNDGLRASSQTLNNPNQSASEVINAAQGVAFFVALIGILLFTHEYRHNTIMYTLTASRSRLRVLLAKIIVVTLFSVLATVLFSRISPLFMELGQHIKGNNLTPQDFPLKDLLLRAAFYGWGYSMFAVIVGVITRNQIASIVAVLLYPGLGEMVLLAPLLNERAKYLPFTALDQVLQTGSEGFSRFQSFSNGHAALLVTGYIVIGWIIAGILFIRRDAN